MAFMEVFITNSVTVVNECQEAFGFDTVRRQIMKPKINFLVKLCKSINSIAAVVAMKYFRRRIRDTKTVDVSLS